MKFIQKNKIFVLILFIIAFTFIRLVYPAQADPNATLIPIGASYEPNTLSFFAQQVLVRDTDSIIQIRVLPITYASNPTNISASERADNLAQAQTRATEIDAACEQVVSPPTICNAQVIDIQIRNDAQNPTLVNQINNTTDGVFVLGGDQTIAMEVTANTLLEDVLETQYLLGLPISGTSAGAAVQSRYMIAGYLGSNSAWDALKLGSVEFWYEALNTTHRGLRFAYEGVIEQHVLERGRIARLLQATEQLPANHIGIGVDWGTGALLQNETQILTTNGAYAAIVVDQETYSSAANATYVGAENILSIHNVGFHVLPPGGFGYDLNNRQPILNGIPQTAPNLANRDYGLALPNPTAGTLFISGDLAGDPVGVVTQDFASLAQATGQPTVIFTVGYTNNNQAINAANTWASRLGQLGVTNIQTAPLTSNANLTTIANQLTNAGAIFTVGGSQVHLADQIATLQNAGIDQVLLQRWQTGGHLLFDNAAAAAVGSWMSDAPKPANVEIESSDSFINGHVPIVPGLNLLPGTVFEPRFLYDYLYGRLVGHAYAHPNVVGFGIERGTAIKISPFDIRVIGSMAVMTIDARHATFGLGTNNVYAASWLILDTFPSGEAIPAGTGNPTVTPTQTNSGPTTTPTFTPTPTLTSISPTNTPTATPTSRPGRTTPTPTTTSPTITPTPGSSSTMHIGDLDSSPTTGTNGRWNAYVTVTVHDENHIPIAGVTVAGSWSNGASGSSSCVTGANGQCTVSKTGIRTTTNSVTFTVTNATHASYSYQPASNHDPDGDSSGTVIIVHQP